MAELLCTGGCRQEKEIITRTVFGKKKRFFHYGFVTTWLSRWVRAAVAMQSDVSPCLPFLAPTCAWLGWDGGRECFLWKAKDLCSVCQLLPYLCPASSWCHPLPRAATPHGSSAPAGLFTEQLSIGNTPQLQWDYSLSNTFAGTASARSVS